MRAAWLAAVAAALVAGCGGADREPTSAATKRSVLLVSGRDDHGLVAEPFVGVSAAPQGRPEARVRDGTLVAVTGTRGEWIAIRTLEGPAIRGWINDYYLRGTAHLIGSRRGCEVRAAGRPAGRPVATFPPDTQVELVAVVTRGKREWVRIRTLFGAATGWVDRRAVAELPSRRMICGAPAP